MTQVLMGIDRGDKLAGYTFTSQNGETYTMPVALFQSLGEPKLITVTVIAGNKLSKE